MNIWYFHPYGGAPGYGKYLRPYYLGTEWNAVGHSATMFVSQFHHLLDKPEPLPDQFTVGGVRFIALKARAYSGNGVGRLLNMFDFCRSILKTTKLGLPTPDVIIVSSPHPFSVFSAWWLARRQKATLVFEVRDIWPLSITEMSATPKWHPIVVLAAITERFAYRFSDLVASLLGNAEVHMKTKGLASGKFVHVPNGVPEAPSELIEYPSSPVGKEAAAKIQEWRAEGRTVFIHPGTQGHPSALDLLLEAVHLINSKGGSSRLGVILVGGGDTDTQLRKQAVRLKLDNVAFFPAVPKADALWLTAKSDVGYAGKRNFATVFKYGISFNKIVDFMEAGLPVILPIDTKGDPVSESGCGIVTGGNAPSDIAASIDQMLDMTSDERRTMGEKGRAYVKDHLSYRRISKAFIDAISAKRNG